MGGASILRMAPLSRIIGGKLTFRCKSEASNFITVRKSTLIFGSRLGCAGAVSSVVTSLSSAVAIGFSSASSAEAGLESDRDAPAGEVTLRHRDGVFIVMEDA